MLDKDMPRGTKPSEESKETLSSLTVVELKKRLKAKGLPVTGKKDLLIERLGKATEEVKPVKKSGKAKAKTVGKAKTSGKAKTKAAVSKSTKAFEVYEKAVALMGPDKFIEETLVTMKAFEKGLI